MLFSKDIEPRCEYCARGYALADGTQVACKKHGILKSFEKCRSFKYDPLKRVPDSPRSLNAHEFSKSDFSL